MFRRYFLNSVKIARMRHIYSCGILQKNWNYSISSCSSKTLDTKWTQTAPENPKSLYSTRRVSAARTISKDTDKVAELNANTENLAENDENRISKFLRNDEIVVSLKEFLNDCAFTQLTDYGLRVLMYYRERNNLLKANVNLNDLELFHTIMASYARQGNLQKVCEVYEILKKDEISLAPQTFAYLIECIGRLPTTEESTKTLEQFIKEAENNEISLNDIIHKSVFLLDQREIVIKTIRRSNKEFEPVYAAPNLYYTNSLIQHLNSNSEAQTASPKTKKQRFSTAELHNLAKQQLEAEILGNVPMDEISLQSYIKTTPFTAFCTKTLKQLLEKWREQFLIQFKHDLQRQRYLLDLNETCPEINKIAALSLFKPEEYADLCVEHLQSMLQRDGAFPLTIAFMHYNLGHKLALKFEDKLKKEYFLIEQKEDFYKKYCEKLCLTDCTDNPRQIWQRLEVEHGGRIHNKPEFWWTKKKKAVIGRHLFELFIKNTVIDENIVKQTKNIAPKYKPAVKIMFAKRDHTMFYHLNQTLVLLYQEAQSQYKIMADDLPILCPPVPWTSKDNGGFLITNLDLIRSDDCANQLNVIKEWPQTEIYPMLDALNNISNIPWGINNRVLDIIIEAYIKMFDEDMRKWGVSRNDPNGPPSRLLQLFAKMKRSRGEIFYKLLVGNHFRNKVFWFAHSVDYRGRLYPTPPILSYTASDINRSLLLFDEKKPLGSDGLEWLKLYCVNLKGKNKRESLSERIKYANESIDDILDSADKPLTGQMWWIDSDEPWQTLTCCIEIANAIRSPDPSQYLSGFPVQIDGTCNSLQHYAALNRDKELAISVNLTSTEKPQDAYSMFAEMLEKYRVEDAQNNSSIAKALEGYVTRSNVKKMITALVYGSGKERAKSTIEKTLRAIPDFPRDLSDEASRFLAEKAYLVFYEKFQSAKTIQKWLNRCAKYISTDHNSQIEWVTPLGWPVIQPRTLNELDIKQPGSGMNQFLSTEQGAIAPNFIHSLEASHMVLTSLNCEKAGITFISEHDSYGTHACNLPCLNDINREQFLLLYSQPILENLALFFRNKYPKCEEEHNKSTTNSNSAKDEKEEKSSVRNGDLSDIFERCPEKGDFDLREILKSKYFFN